MEKLKQKVIKAVQDIFPGAEVEFDPPVDEDDDRLSGIIVWDGFQDRDHLDRQRTLRLGLEARLTPEEMAYLSFFLAATPQELGRLQAG